MTDEMRLTFILTYPIYCGVHWIPVLCKYAMHSSQSSRWSYEIRVWSQSREQDAEKVSSARRIADELTLPSPTPLLTAPLRISFKCCHHVVTPSYAPYAFKLYRSILFSKTISAKEFAGLWTLIPDTLLLVFILVQLYFGLKLCFFYCTLSYRWPLQIESIWMLSAVEEADLQSKT